jgi:hypothetical protein
MEEIKATVKTKRDLTEEEMEKVNGGCMSPFPDARFSPFALRPVPVVK